MTFYDNEDLSNIIKEYRFKDNRYIIRYLDNSVSEFVCTKDNYNKILEEKMYNQAKDRNEKLYNKVKKELYLSLQMGCLSFMSLVFTHKSNILFMDCLIIILLIYSLKEIKNNAKKLHELYKYKLYISIKKDLEKEENKTILDILDYDKFFQNPVLNLSNLDTYSLSDIKTLKKEIDLRNQRK